MPTEFNNIQLKFNCPANWDEMQPLNGCRFCSNCQKKVYDFIGSTRQEYEQVLLENNNLICGRFMAEQAATPAIVKPFWIKWVSAAMILLGFNLISCKEKNNQSAKDNKAVKANDSKKTPNFVMGEPLRIQPDTIDPTDLHAPLTFNDKYDTFPSFPGGDQALNQYLNKHIPYVKDAPAGKVITSFIVNTEGRITDIRILRGLTPAAEQAIVKVLKNSPKWHPGIHRNKPISVRYTMPVYFKG